MKKYFILSVAALVVLPMFLACHKSDSNTDDPTVELVVMDDPVTKEVAKTIEFKANALPVYVDDVAQYEILSIEFTEGGRYIMKRRVAAITKVEVGDVETVVGTYTESNGTYNMEGFGEVTVSEGSGTQEVEVKPAGEENADNATTTQATVTQTTTSSTEENNISRTWSVANTLLKVSGSGVSIEKTFTGLNLQEMAKYAASNGVSKLSDKLDRFAGYTVKNLIFTGDNTICFDFTGASAQSATSLVKAGLCEYEYREIFRRPDTGAPAEAEEIVLSPEQEAVFSGLRAQMDSGKPEAALIYGVTGSGKTSVYIRLAKEAVRRGRTAIVLVPEIGLTPQFVSIFSSHFGDSVAVLHSSLSAGERYDEWKRIRSGLVRVVIGTRSAVFAPLADIGLITLYEVIIFGLLVLKLLV